jgi:hypothetical protein
VSQSSEFCRHNPLCCFSTGNSNGIDWVRKLLDTPSYAYQFLSDDTLEVRFVLHVRQKLYWVVSVKVKLSLCLTKYYTMKTYWGGWKYSSTHSYSRHHMDRCRHNTYIMTNFLVMSTAFGINPFNKRADRNELSIMRSFYSHNAVNLIREIWRPHVGED